MKFQQICVRIVMFRFGALAQLGERYTGSVEVSGSIPLCSTKQISDEHLVFQRLFCNKGLNLIQTQKRCRRISYSSVFGLFVNSWGKELK